MGNQQESDMELSGIKPKKDVQSVSGPKAVTTVGRRWYVAGQRSAQDWKVRLFHRVSASSGSVAISPCGQIRGTNRSKAIEAPERVSRGGENRLEGSA
jgi:hypothetical protein